MGQIFWGALMRPGGEGLDLLRWTRMGRGRGGAAEPRAESREAWEQGAGDGTDEIDSAEAGQAGGEEKVQRRGRRYSSWEGFV